MANGPPDGLSRYQRAILRARNRALQLSIDQERELLRLVRSYADDLADRAARLYEAKLEERLRDVAQEVANGLVDDLERRTAQGVEVTAREVRDIHAEAMTRILAQNDRSGVRVGLGAVDVGAAQAVLSRPELANAMVSVRQGHAGTVDEIITESLLRGTDTRPFAMRLRHHMVGAEAVPDRFLDDRRRITYAGIEEMGLEPTRENLLRVRYQARQVADKAELIARTETMNAEWEAGRMSAEDSPIIGGVKWNLSSRHPEPDECDVLARTDFYELGAGVYPPENLPSRPHPRCICYMTHRLRPIDEWGEERETPLMATDPADAAGGAELSPSRERSLYAALQVGDVRTTEAFEAPRPSVYSYSQSKAIDQRWETDLSTFSRITGRAVHAEARRQGAPRLHPLRPPPNSFEDRLLRAERSMYVNSRNQPGLTREDGAVFDTTGGVVPVQFTRYPTALHFRNDEAERLRGNIFTHTHPPESGRMAFPFSTADLTMARSTQVAEIRAVSGVASNAGLRTQWGEHAVVHRLRPPGETGLARAARWPRDWTDEHELKDRLDDMKDSIRRRIAGEMAASTGLPESVFLRSSSMPLGNSDFEELALRILFSRHELQYTRTIIRLIG